MILTKLKMVKVFFSIILPIELVFLPGTRLILPCSFLTLTCLDVRPDKFILDALFLIKFYEYYKKIYLMVIHKRRLVLPRDHQSLF